MKKRVRLKAGPKTGGLVSFDGLINRLETLFKDLAELHEDLGVKGTDRTYISFRKIFELRPGFDAAMRLSALFIVHIVAHRTDISRRLPFLKPPLADPSLSFHTTDWTYVVFREIFEWSPPGDSIMGFAAEGRIHIAAELAFIANNRRLGFLHGFCRFFSGD